MLWKSLNYRQIKVLSSHTFEILTHQKKHIFKLVPNLSEENLLPTHFSKMKVVTSTNVINHSVRSVLNFLAKVLNEPKYITPA